jgi:hypothetical protein
MMSLINSYPNITIENQLWVSCYVIIRTLLYPRRVMQMPQNSPKPIHLALTKSGDGAMIREGSPAVQIPFKIIY